MFTLKELVGLLRKGLEVYEGIAEDNGQCGDIYLYEEMMKEHALVDHFCKELETEYVQYQTLHTIQLHTLLSERGESLYTAVSRIVESYNNNLDLEIEKLRDKQDRLGKIQGVIAAIKS